MLLVQKKVVKVLMILIIITRMVKLPRLGQIRGRVAGAATWVARTGGLIRLFPSLTACKPLHIGPAVSSLLLSNLDVSGAIARKKGVEGFKHYSVKHSQSSTQGTQGNSVTVVPLAPKSATSAGVAHQLAAAQHLQAN